MKALQNRIFTVLGLLALASIFFSAQTAPTFAARCIRQDFDTSEEYMKCVNQENETREVITPQATPTQSGDTGGSSGDMQRERSSSKDNIYEKIVNPGIIVLSGAVILVIVGNVVVGGIQYITSNGSSSAVASAKNRIFVAVVCLVVYIFGFALLQWLIPGGIR